MRSAGCLTAVSLTLVCVGCTSDVPEGIPVEGMVSFRGAPLKQGSIEFSPIGDQGVFSGAPIAEGNYVVPEESGLTPGEYQVRISSSSEDSAAAEEAPGESAVTAEELIPPEFNVATSLTVQVKEDQENRFDFQIP